MFNKFRTIVGSLIAAVSLFILSACGGQVTVTFDAAGGSAVQAVVDKAGEVIVSEPVSEKDGYSFEGWFVDDEKVVFPYTLEKNVTFVAEWELISYDVVFHVDGGSTMESFSYTVEDDVIYLDDPVKPGYAFLGWFENELLQGQAILSIPEGSTGNLELYASWDVIEYNINYNSNGGELSNLAASKYAITSSTIALLSPTKVGYTFEGWYDNASFTGTKIESIIQGSTGHKTLYAHWVPTSFQVSFVVYGGSTIATDEFTIEDSELVLPIPERTGYTFGGWYTNAVFAGDVVTSIVSGSTGNKTFHARWNPISYTINYQLNQGSFEGEFPESFTADDTIDLVNPTRAGYEFGGWYDNALFTGNPITSIAAGQTGNREFFAKWEVSTFDYTISYTLNQGTLTAGYPQGYYAGVEVTLPIPTRLGATFDGWYDNATFTGVSMSTISPSDSGNKTFYARWSLINYTITYVQNGGSGAVDRSFTVESGAITLDATTRSGFTFDGWYTSAEFTGDPVTSLAIRSTGNRVFYAKWTAETTQYLINYQFLYEGSFPMVPKTTYTAGDATFNLPVPQRTYYIFLGWKNNPLLTGDYITEVVSGSTGNLELYAVWAAETYNITYNLNGGTGAATGQYSYKAPNIEFPDPALETLLPVPTRSGYIFGGWYTDAALTDTVLARPGSGAVSVLKAGANGNRVFYAKWISGTVASSVKTFEAENTNLIGKSGSGWSGSATGSNMIVPDTGASAGNYVGWLTNEGTFLEFSITSDRAVSNATLTVAVNMEMIRDQVVLADVTLNNTNYSIMVNGQSFTFSKLVTGGDDPYHLPITNIVLTNVNLLAGTNTVLLVNGKNTFWDGRQAGPGIDCIKIESTAQLTWVPITYN